MPIVLLSLPPELLLIIAAKLPPPAHHALFSTNKYLSSLLYPRYAGNMLHHLARRGCKKAALFRVPLHHAHPKAAAAALSAACRYGHAKTVEIMLAAVRPRVDHLRDALRGKKRGASAVFALLLEKLEPPGRQLRFESEEAGRKHETVLHTVAASGSLGLTGQLLTWGHDIDARDGGRRTPLHCAVQNGRRDVVKCLLEHGAKVSVVDSAGNTPLHLAARSRRRSCAWLLLQNGADADHQNHSKKTAKMIAGPVLIRVGQNSNWLILMSQEVSEESRERKECVGG